MPRSTTINVVNNCTRVGMSLGWVTWVVRPLRGVGLVTRAGAHRAQVHGALAHTKQHARGRADEQCVLVAHNMRFTCCCTRAGVVSVASGAAATAVTAAAASTTIMGAASSGGGSAGDTGATASTSSGSPLAAPPPVPLLVTVLAGNPVTAINVLASPPPTSIASDGCTRQLCRGQTQMPPS